MQFRTKIVAAGIVLVALIAFAPKIKAVSPTLVDVVNSLDEWIPTGSIDEPGRAPVQIVYPVSPDTATAIYTVPANKRLVIRNATVSCNSSTTAISGYLNVTLGGNTGSISFPLTPLNVTFPNGLVKSMADAQLLAYSDAQTTVQAGVETVGLVQGKGASTGTCVISLTGYLATLPITITAPPIG